VDGLENSGARLLKNASARLLNEAILVVSSFAIAIPLARVWGAESFGRYAFATAFVGLFTFSFDWGLNWLLTREVARDRGNVAKYLNNALGLTLALSSVTMALLVALINVFDYPPETVRAVYLAGTWTLLDVFASLFIRGAFYAFEKMEYETPPLLAERLFVVVFGLAAIAARTGLIALMWVLVVSRAIKLAVCALIYTKRIGRPAIECDWPFWRALARSAFPFGLNLAFGLIYAKVDITMLSVLRGDEAEIGFYRAALALVMYWPLVGSALNSSLLPVMSELYPSRRESFTYNYQRSLQWLLSMGLPMTLGLCLLADRLVTFVYGQSFMPSVVSLRILSLSVLLKLVHGNLAMVLTSSDRQSLRASIVAFAAVSNVIMNGLLIPWRGYVGASVAAVLTDALIAVACYYLVSQQLGGMPLLAVITRPALSGMVMGLYVLVFRGVPLLVLVPSAAVIYVGVLYGLGGLAGDELARLRAMLLMRWQRWREERRTRSDLRTAAPQERRQSGKPRR
jgi:O-antigen/teichoic acid export membrane protein